MQSSNQTSNGISTLTKTAPASSTGGSLSYQKVSSATRSYLHSNNPEFAVFDILALKGKGGSSYQLVTAYQNNLARNIVDTLKSVKPEMFEKYTETQIYELLKSNMILNC